MTGARVGVAEEDKVGGTCVVRGCIPKKFMVYASDFAHQFKTAKAYGWSFGKPAFSWRDFLTAKDIEIARLSGVYTANLAKAGAELIRDRARLVGPHEDRAGEGGAHRHRRPDPDRHGRPALGSGETARDRTRHHVGRGLPPARAAQAHPDRRRRLYRGGVRRHLRRHGLGSDPGLSRVQHPARLRRRRARPRHRRVGKARRARDPGRDPRGGRKDPHGPAQPPRRRHRVRDRPGNVRGGAAALREGPGAGGRGRRAHRRRGGQGRRILPHQRPPHLGHRRRHRPDEPDPGGHPRGHRLRRDCIQEQPQEIRL